MFKFIYCVFALTLHFLLLYIQFFIEEEIKLEQPQPILIKDTSKNKIYLKFFFKNTLDNNNIENNIETLEVHVIVPNYMGAIDQGYNTNVLFKFRRQMSGKYLYIKLE